MKFFFDESGDFGLVDDGIQRVGIVVGITIPECAEGVVLSKFDDFVAKLGSSAFKKGEPRGNRLTSNERRAFAQMIADDNRIVVTPAMLDISSLNRAKQDARENLVHRMRELSKQCVHETMRELTELLSRQFNNLSDNQALRLGAWAYCLKRAFEQSIVLLSGEQYFDCWQNLRFEVDPVQTRQGSREEQVFKWTMLGWLQGWSQKDPIMIIDEIHTDDHPLIKNYSTPEEKFDLTKIYRDNLHYTDSSESKGIQIADMAASIIHNAVNGIVTQDELASYGLLLRNNLWSPRHAVGLFCMTDTENVDYDRYYGLTGAITRAKE